MATLAAVRALAKASASLVVTHDIPGTLSDLILGSLHALGADAGAIMVTDRSRRLELLAASSHREAELELFESQHHDGPSVEASSSGNPVVINTITDAHPWPQFGPLMYASGYQTLLAVPLRWNLEALGSMTLLRHSKEPFSADDRIITQAFADTATMAIIHNGRISVRSATQRIEEALSGRVVIEQAKGVLSYTHGIAMPEAFEELRRISSVEHATLTETARRIVRAAERP